jgi:hypothetical protein
MNRPTVIALTSTCLPMDAAVSNGSSWRRARKYVASFCSAGV